MAGGLLKVKGTQLYYTDYDDAEHLLTGEEVEGTLGGNLKVKGIYLDYEDNDSTHRRLLGILTGNTGTAGRLKVKGKYIRYIDNEGDERVILPVIYPIPAFTGWCRHYDVGQYHTWDELRGAAGNEAYHSAGIYFVFVAPRAVEDKWGTIARAILCFDTSELSGINIANAYLVFYVVEKVDTLGLRPSIFLFSSAPTGETSLIPSDYARLGAAGLSHGLAWGSLVVGWNYLTLNEGGIAAIKKEGISKFGIRILADVSGFEPDWVSYPASAYLEVGSSNPESIPLRRPYLAIGEE